MATSDDVVTALVKELRRLVSPLVMASIDEGVRESLFAAIGWELAQLEGFPVGKLATRASAIATAASALAESAKTGPQSLDDVGAMLDDARRIFDDVRALAELAQDPALNVAPAVRTALAGLGRAVSEFLVVE